MSPLARLAAWLRDRRGAATVEFAVIAPIAFFVIAAGLEAMRLSVCWTLIDHALFLGVRDAKLHQGQNAENLVREQLRDWRFGLYDLNDVKLDFQYAQDVSMVKDAGTAGSGTSGSFVRLQADCRIGLLKGLLPRDQKMSGTRRIVIYYMNEPWEDQQ